jgi:hypothetical protein
MDFSLLMRLHGDEGRRSQLDMEVDPDDDNFLIAETLDAPGVGAESILDKQRAALKLCLDSLPYKCESIDEMQAKFEEIVTKIVICVHAKNWRTLRAWDGMLQSYDPSQVV